MKDVENYLNRKNLAIYLIRQILYLRSLAVCGFILFTKKTQYYMKNYAIKVGCKKRVLIFVSIG